MLSLVVCRCLFRLMRRYFLGRWICLLVSERLRLVWKCRLFGCNTYIQFCVHWHGGQNNLNKLNIKTTSLLSKTNHELVHTNPQRNIFSDAGVDCIPCKNCKLKYISETSQNLHVRLKEHKRHIRIGNLNNALFQHISRSNHNFDFNFAKMLIYIHNKGLRRIFETAISLCNSPNTRSGFYNISPYFCKSILNSYNIFHL